MDKGRRQELTRLKFKRRLNNMNVSAQDLERYDYRHYKTTSTPCSCWMCKGERYKDKERAESKRITRLEYISIG